MFAETLGIDALTCVELRFELESRGLDKGGRKAELVARLEESLHLELQTGAAWWSASEDDDDAHDESDERDVSRRDDDDGDAAPIAGIRVLTLNVCVIPSGMRNYNIPSLGLYGGILVGALALAALVGAWWCAACHLFRRRGRCLMPSPSSASLMRSGGRSFLARCVSSSRSPWPSRRCSGRRGGGWSAGSFSRSLAVGTTSRGNGWRRS